MKVDAHCTGQIKPSTYKTPEGKQLIRAAWMTKQSVGRGGKQEREGAHACMQGKAAVCRSMR